MFESNFSYPEEREMVRMTLWQKLMRMDWGLFALILGLGCISCLVVYSATYTSESEVYRKAYVAQAGWLVLGIFGYFIVALTDYRVWFRFVVPAFIFTVILLIAIFKIGRSQFGAVSWIKVGPVNFQPSELCKIVFVLFISWILVRTTERGFRVFCLCFFLTSVPAILILKQPALGSAMVFFPIAYAVMFVGGVKKRFLALPLVAGLILAALTYHWMHPADPSVQPHIPFLKPFQEKRILTFFDPSIDPKGAAWTINQSLIAIGSGGFEGKGFLRGTITTLGFLPSTISYNDFIFPVICEQFGFRGGAALIILLGTLLLWIIKIAYGTTDSLGTYVAVGIAAMLFTHIFVNIGMTIKVVPITGIPLPFISYGGTFLLVCLSSIGLVQSIWIHRRN